MKITKVFIINIIFFLFSFKFLSASDFENWKIDFKKKALDEGISIKTLNRVTVSYTHLTLPTTYEV